MESLNLTVLKEMLAQTVMLGNSFSARHKEDSVKVIEFVLRINGDYTEEAAKNYAELINGELAAVRIPAHYRFLAANRLENELDEELQSLYDVKGAVFDEYPCQKEVCAYSAAAAFIRAKGLIKEHTVEAYNFLGTLLALGIGAEKNLAKAKECFTCGSYYGDAYAMKALAEVCAERGEDKETGKWRSVYADLDSDAGMPSMDIEDGHYETGFIIYLIMTAHKAGESIDVALVEALNNERIPFATKKELVANGRPVELFDKFKGRLGYGFRV